MNQPYLQYPSNTAGNADTLMESLGFFWNNIFHERGTLQGLTFAQAEQVVQQYYALESAVNSLAADTLPVLNRIRRFPLIIKRSAVTHVSPVFGDGSSWGAQPTGSNPLFEQVTFKFGGEKVNNLGLQLFAWKPPVVLQSFALLADQLVRPSKVLINNVDAKIAHGSLLFKVHPFTLPNVRPAWLFNENGSPAMFADANNRVTQDSVIVLWAFEAKIDEQAAATAYGWLFDVVQPSSATYSGVLRGLLKLYGNGGSVNHIKSAVAAFLGVKPVVYDGEVVEQIFQYTPTLELALSQTPPPPPPPPPTSSPCIAGWTLVNFIGTTFRNGDPIPEITDQSLWNAATGPAWCYYNNDSANEDIYGKLYNRFAVTDVRGLAPVGYHVPTLAEYENIITCLGGTDAGSGFWLVAGEKMKTAGTIEDDDGSWNSPNVASNESGFSVVPAGCRTSSFINLHARGSFWVSDSDTVINFNHAASYVYIGPDAPTVGYSIRLKQDQVPPTPPTPPTPPGFNQASIRVVQTDRNIYTADSYFQTLPSVIVGAKLASGDVLFDVVEYYDVIEDPTWWLTRVVPKVNQVHTVGSTAVTRKMGFSPSLFAGSCDGELTFKNDVELFTQDAAGNLHFPVEGSRVDVASFNAQLNLNKVAIATAVGLTPGGSVVINPLDFLFNNFLKTGTALIKVNFKSIKQAELFTATFRHIKDALPRNVLFIFFLDFNLPIDSYKTLNSSTPILLNGSPVMANADGTNSSGMLVPTATPNYRTNVKTRLFGLSKGVTDTQLLVAINSGSLGSNDLLIKDGSMLTNIPTGKTTKEVNNLLLMNFN